MLAKTLPRIARLSLEKWERGSGWNLKGTGPSHLTSDSPLLDEWAQESQLTAVTSGYMSFQDQVMAVKGCVNALKHKAEWIMAREELT